MDSYATEYCTDWGQGYADGFNGDEANTKDVEDNDQYWEGYWEGREDYEVKANTQPEPAQQ